MYQKRVYCILLLVKVRKADYIIATAWNGRGAVLGTASVHSWNDGMDDLEEEPVKVNAGLQPLFPSATSGNSPLRTRRSRRGVADDDSDFDPFSHRGL